MKKLYKDIKANRGGLQFKYPYIYITGCNLKDLLNICLKHAKRLNLKVYKHIDPIKNTWDFIIIE